jgi:nitrate reductase gamma subunit
MPSLGDDLNHFFFGVYPYIALSILLLGSWIRYDREPFTWRSGSSELLRRRSLVLGSNLWHVGILVVLCGHFVGFMTPPSWYERFGFTMQDHQMLAMVAGGLFGAVAWLGLTLLVVRRFGDHRILRTSSVSDLYILALLWIQLTIGLSTLPISWSERLNPADTAAVGAWARDILTFQGGAADLVAHVRLDIRFHMVLGMTILGTLLPFTRLVHIWSAPVWYLFRRYQIVRTRFTDGGDAVDATESPRRRASL